MPAIDTHAAATFVWVDDGLIISPAGDAAASLVSVESALREIGMTLHPEKTFSGAFDENGNAAFDFLGFDLAEGQPVPSPESRAALLSALEICADTDDFAGVVDNCVGWMNYFDVNATWTGLAVFDAQVQSQLQGRVPFLPSLKVLAERREASRKSTDFRQTRTGRTKRETRWETRSTFTYLPGEDDYGNKKLFGTKRHDAARGEVAPGAGSTTGSSALRPGGREDRSRRGRLRRRLKNIARELHAIIEQFPELRRGVMAEALGDAFRALDVVTDTVMQSRARESSDVSEGDELTALTFVVAADQKAEIELALDRAAELSNNGSRSGRLSLICTDFVATNDSVRGEDNRLRHLARIERALGIHLVGIERETLRPLYGWHRFVEAAARLGTDE